MLGGHHRGFLDVVVATTAVFCSWPVGPDGLRGEAVALDLETLQVLGKPHLKAENLKHQIRLLQQLLALASVLGPDHSLQQVVELAFDPLSQYKPVVSGNLCPCAGMTRGSSHRSW